MYKSTLPSIRQEAAEAEAPRRPREAQAAEPFALALVSRPGCTQLVGSTGHTAAAAMP